jgi:hypothetical protein
MAKVSKVLVELVVAEREHFKVDQPIKSAFFDVANLVVVKIKIMQFS